MVENFNKYTCDSCDYEISIPVGRTPNGWSCSKPYGDLCPDCLGQLRGFFRSFYGDETELCKLILHVLNRDTH